MVGVLKFRYQELRRRICLNPIIYDIDNIKCFCAISTCSIFGGLGQSPSIFEKLKESCKSTIIQIKKNVLERTSCFDFYTLLEDTNLPSLLSLEDIVKQKIQEAAESAIAVEGSGLVCFPTFHIDRKQLMAYAVVTPAPHHSSMAAASNHVLVLRAILHFWNIKI